MMVVVRKGCVLIAATCLAMGGIASAPAYAFSKRVEQACSGDYKRLCPAYKTSSPQLRACMESKANEITPGCIDALVRTGEVDKKRVRR
jgi:hypothetical protein